MEPYFHSIIEMVKEVSAIDNSHSLPAVLRKVKGYQLFAWWIEATDFEAKAENEWERALARATASELAKEAIRRLGDE